MESYAEYPIRCQTCNSQLSCLSEQYEDYLIAGFSIKEALDELRLTRYCCRIAMMNPINVTFNMENREVIEGLKAVDVTDQPNDHESSGNTIFGSCLMMTPQTPTNTMLTQVTTLTAEQRNLLAGVKVPTALPRPAAIGGQKSIMGQINIQGIKPVLPLIPPLTAMVPQPLVPSEPVPEIPNVEIPAIGMPEPAIEVEGQHEGQFLIPDRVGFPTINTDPSKGSRYIYVGPGRQNPIKVLGGCTFLAQ